jgi:hypothetical protein
MIKFKDILKEEVPIDKLQRVKSGLEKKYGTGELSEYTFGIELEFEPGDETENVDKIRLELENNSDVHGDYIEWLMNQRSHLNRRVSDVESWDDSYGPIDVDTFDELSPDMMPGDYSDNEEYEKALEDWREKRKEVEIEYRRFDRTNINEYYDDYIEQLISSGNWRNYVDPQDVVDRDVEGEILDAISYIRNKMGENVQYGDSNVNTWGVGPDGDNVEIRSKHLNQTEFNLVSDICSYVRGKEVGGGTSAHVHIGLPTDFDAFDLLAITTLVDERTIKQTVGPQRELSSWAKLRTYLNNQIVHFLLKTPENQSTNEKSFILTNERLFQLLSDIGRYWGTNVAAMRKSGTIEFRYLSSEVTRQPDVFIKWIQYYLLLPKVAKSRNRVILKQTVGSDSQSVTAIRQSGGVKFILNGSGSTPNLPAATLKAGQQVPVVSPKFTRVKKEKELEKQRQLAKVQI